MTTPGTSPTLLPLACLLVACGPIGPMSPADSTTSTTSNTSTTATSSTTTPTSGGSSSDPADSTTAAPSTSTSDAPSTSTTNISDDPGSTSCQFFCPGDVGTGIPSCDPYVQDCPEGEKCTPYSDDGSGNWNNDRCVPIFPDPALPGEPCTVEGDPASGIDTCALGSLCWDVDPGTLMGTCILLCTGSSEMGICPEPLTCGIFNNGTLPLCLTLCDPLSQDCPPDEVCIENQFGFGFVCVLDVSVNEGQAFDPCEFLNACDPGLACKEPASASECDPDTTGCCTPYCDLTLPPDCPDAMQICKPYFGMDPVPQGYENVGYCSLPP